MIRPRVNGPVVLDATGCFPDWLPTLGSSDHLGVHESPLSASPVPAKSKPLLPQPNAIPHTPSSPNAR